MEKIDFPDIFNREDVGRKVHNITKNTRTNAW
jgi:hypothetical protein